MDIPGRFVAQLIENPAYFKKAAPVNQEPVWEHWDKAIPLLIAVGAIIILLIGYKIGRGYISKHFLSKIVKKLRR